MPERTRRRRGDKADVQHGYAVQSKVLLSELEQQTSTETGRDNNNRHERKQELSFEEILRISIDLDETAKKNIRQIIADGSKRLAEDIIDLLDSALRAVELNSNLLQILRLHTRSREAARESAALTVADS